MTDNLKKELYQNMAIGIKNGELEYLNDSMPSYEELKNSPSEFFKHVWDKTLLDEAKAKHMSKIYELYKGSFPHSNEEKNKHMSKSMAYQCEYNSAKFNSSLARLHNRIASYCGFSMRMFGGGRYSGKTYIYKSKSYCVQKKIWNGRKFKIIQTMQPIVPGDKIVNVIDNFNCCKNFFNIIHDKTLTN